MTLLKTSMACLLGLAITACESKPEPKVNDSAPKVVDTPAVPANNEAPVAKMTTASLELAKVP